MDDIYTKVVNVWDNYTSLLTTWVITDVSVNIQHLMTGQLTLKVPSDCGSVRPMRMEPRFQCMGIERQVRGRCVNSATLSPLRAIVARALSASCAIEPRPMHSARIPRTRTHFAAHAKCGRWAHSLTLAICDPWNLQLKQITTNTITTITISWPKWRIRASFTTHLSMSHNFQSRNHTNEIPSLWAPNFANLELCDYCKTRNIYKDTETEEDSWISKVTVIGDLVGNQFSVFYTWTRDYAKLKTLKTFSKIKIKVWVFQEKHRIRGPIMSDMCTKFEAGPLHTR